MDPEKMDLNTRKHKAFRNGVIGGALGAITGLVVLTAGDSIPALTGNKEDTLALGLITIIISIFAAYCIHRASKETSTDLNRRIGWLLGAFIPGIIGFTTAGLIWILPGGLFIGTSVLLMVDLIDEFKEKDLDLFPEQPRWKRTVILAGALVILIPVIFGGFVPTTEMAHLEQDGDEYFVRPIDRVIVEGAGGEDSSSEVTGVMMIHIVMIIGAMVALITGQVGARILTIASAVIVAVSLLFFFLLLPNIMFVEGAKFSQFDAEHFSALSGGWFMAMFGSLLLLISQFLKRENDEEGHGHT
ncbi:MAG: hypothetical protein ACMUHM_00095 [Thermoplasmatota archaeon]